jgi:hypothetical protein
MRLHYLLIFPLILLITVWMARMNSTEDSDYWVYQFHEGETAYEITRTDARMNTTELITSIPYIADFSLASIMPPEELAAAESFVASNSIMTDEEPSAEETYSFFNSPASPRLIQIVASPNKQTVAMFLRYMKCTNYPHTTCFGLNQIVLYTIATDEQHILWSVPIQAKTTFFPSSEDYSYVHSDGMAAVFISDLRWTPNQEAIVAQLEYNIYQTCDSPLVLIPIDTPENAFVLGNGDSSWAVSPNNYEVATIHQACSLNSLHPQYVFSVVRFDTSLSQVSRLSYPINLYLEHDNFSELYGGRIAYFRNMLVFQVLLRSPVNDIWVLATYDYRTGNFSWINGLPQNDYKYISGSSSAEHLILQDNEGYLWQLIPSSDSFTLVSLTHVPVTSWRFANDDELIIQFEGDDYYSVVNIPQ